MQLQDTDTRLNDLIEAIISIAGLDFSKKLLVSGRDDLIDVVSSGFNMLSEALEETVVSKDALQESEEKYKMLFSTANDAIIIMRSGKLRECNKKALEFFACEERDIIGKSLKEFITKFHAPEFLGKNFIRRISKEVQEKGFFNFPIRYKRKDNSFFNAETSMAVFNLNGESYVHGIIRDVTKKKEIEDALRKNMAQFKALFDHAPNPMLLTSNRRFLRINPAFQELFGYSASEIHNLSINHLTHPEDREMHIPYEAMLISKEIQKFSLEKRYVKKNGEIFHGSVNLSLIQTKEQQPLFIVQIQDITTRKLAEKQVNDHLLELQKTNEELDKFAYIVSHDLKAPLRGISTLADFIQEDIKSGNTEEVIENMDLLKGRVTRMSNLINGILEYSRIGKMEGELSQIDLNQFLPEIIELIAPPSNVTIEIDPSLPNIYSIKTGIQQIFQNLISNAIKYNDKDQCVIKIRFTNHAKNYEFRIKDNGPGIPKEYHQKIFGIFQTLQPRDRVESTGVGLSIVKKRVEHLGGRIRVISQEGMGSTFIFNLKKHCKN